MPPPTILIAGSDHAGKSALLNTLRHTLHNPSFLSQLASHSLKSPPDSPHTSSSSAIPSELPELVECRDDQLEAWIRLRGRKRAILCIYLLQPNDFPLQHPPSRPTQVLSRIYALMRRYTYPNLSTSNDGQRGANPTLPPQSSPHIALLPVLSKSDAYTLGARVRAQNECRSTLDEQAFLPDSGDMWSIVCPDWAELDQLLATENGHRASESSAQNVPQYGPSASRSSPPRSTSPDATTRSAENKTKEDPLSRLASLCASLSPPSSPEQTRASPNPSAPVPTPRITCPPPSSPFVRDYPWGKCDPFNPQHSDLIKLLEWTFRKADELLAWTPPKEEYSAAFADVDMDESISPSSRTIEGTAKNSGTMEDDDMGSTCVPSPYLLEDSDGRDPEQHLRRDSQRQQYLKEKSIRKASSIGDGKSFPPRVHTNPDDSPNGPLSPPLLSPSGRRWPAGPQSAPRHPDDRYGVNGHLPHPPHPTMSQEVVDESIDDDSGEWRREPKRRRPASAHPVASANEEFQQPYAELGKMSRATAVPTSSVAASNATQDSPHPSASQDSSTAGNGRLLLPPPPDSMITSDPPPVQLLTPPTPHDTDFRSHPPCVPSSGSSVSFEAYPSPANHSDSTHHHHLPHHHLQHRHDHSDHDHHHHAHAQAQRNHKPRKPKTLLACNFCRSRKLKCYPVSGPTDNYSCNECTKRNIACEVAADREVRRTEREQQHPSNLHHLPPHDREDKPRLRTNNDEEEMGAVLLSRENEGRPLAQARIEQNSTKEIVLKIPETPMERKDKEAHSVLQAGIRLSHPYDPDHSVSASRPVSHHQQANYQQQGSHSHPMVSLNGQQDERSLERVDGERGARLYGRHSERDRRASDPLDRGREREVDMERVRYRDGSRERHSLGRDRHSGPPPHHRDGSGGDRSSGRAGAYPSPISQHSSHSHSDSLPLAHLPHHVPSQSQPGQPHHPNSTPHHTQHYPRHGSHSQSHGPPPLHTPVHASQAHLPNHLPPPPGSFHPLVTPGHSHPSNHADRSHATIHFSPTSPTSSNSSRLPMPGDTSPKRRSIDGGVVLKPFAKAPSSRSGPKVVACNYCRARKTRCDGNTPCLNCKKRSLNCEYQIPSREAARRKKAQQAAAAEMASGDAGDTISSSPNRSRPSTSGSTLDQGDHPQGFPLPTLPPVHDRPPSSKSAPSFSPRLPSIAHLVSPTSPVDGHSLKSVFKRGVTPDEDTRSSRGPHPEESYRQSKRMRLDALVNTPSP